jgi:hypothetical protein
MTLSVDLSPAQSTLLYQQDMTFAVTLRNAGAQELSVRKSSMDESVPIVHTLHVRTGIERWHRRPPRGKTAEAFPLNIAPGAAISDQFDLMDIVEDLEPGEYDVSVIWTYGMAQKAESPAVRVNVLSATPRGLFLADAIGGVGEAKFGVWVNLAREPFTLVRSTLQLKPGLTVISRNLGVECTAACRPVLAAPVRDEVLTTHWVAWIEARDLVAFCVNDFQGIGKPQRLSLAAAPATILGPLHGQASPTDEAAWTDGGALLCYTQASQFTLQTVELTQTRLAVRQQAVVAGPGPGWAHCHARTDGDRLVTFAQWQNDTVTLRTRPWPGFPAKGSIPDKWHQWPGVLLGGAAAFDLNEKLHGALLLVSGAEGQEKKIMLASWSISAKNEFALGPQRELERHAGMPIDDCAIGISDRGEAVALIRDKQGTWDFYGYDGKRVELPFGLARTFLPIRPGFLRGNGQPLLICGRLERGLSIVQLDGTPLPRFEKQE